MRVTVIGSAPSEDRWENVEVRVTSQVKPEYQYFNSQSRTWTNVGNLDSGRKAFIAGVVAAGAGFRKKVYSAKQFQLTFSAEELKQLQMILPRPTCAQAWTDAIHKLKP